LEPNILQKKFQNLNDYHLIYIDQKMIEAARQKQDPGIPNDLLEAFEVRKSDVEKLTDKLIKKTYDHARS
jgi:DNA-binding MarR family transcriptional regulator